MKVKRLLSILVAGLLVLCIAMPAFAAEDYSMLGVYTNNGYKNEYFNYQLNLPAGNWTLESRGLFVPVGSDIVTEANKESTLSFLKTSLDLSAATGFEANSDSDYVAITIESPGVINDSWADEETIAENTYSSVIEDLESGNTEDVSVTQIEAQVDYLDHFIDGKHYCCVYKCLLNGVPYYGVQIYVRSRDAKYLSVFDIQSFDPENIEAITNAVTKLN